MLCQNERLQTLPPNPQGKGSVHRLESLKWHKIERNLSPLDSKVQFQMAYIIKWDYWHRKVESPEVGFHSVAL